MPFSELLGFSKGKVDPTQQRTSNLSSDLSFQGDSECCELVWENGQIVMRNQSVRDRKGPSSNNLPSFVSKPQDGKDAKNSKGKFSSIASALNDFPLSAPPCDRGLDEDDNTVPWLNCPVVEPFSNGYCPDILPESFVVTGNEFTQSNSTATSLRLQQGSTSKIPSSATELSRLRNGEATSFMQSQHTMPRSGNSEVTCSEAGNASHINLKNTIPCSSSMGGSTGMKLHKSNGQPSNASGLMNFSYFSRFASLSGVNTRNTATNAGAATSCTKTAVIENKGNALSGHNHMESTLANSSAGFTQQESGSHAQPAMPPVNGRVELVPPQSDAIPPQQSVAICLERDGKGEKSSMPTKLVVGGEKIPEPAVATSSVCSGNSLERDSNDPANSLKRKCRETGDSEGPSEEVEGESVGVRKTVHNSAGSKRSRAAEVHNQSERRRRERINEKMRALQELIPNCNKVDKASMLDEAIEYLKTLQLQLQILSMGTGMYLSPMMLPAAMQHIHRAHMSQFSQMGIGMGAALGLGMGMPDVNTMMQMSSMQGPCYPVSGPPISSPSGFYGAVSSSHQGLGHLGQGLSVSTPHAPHPHLAGIPMRLPMGNVSGMPGMADVLANSSMNQGPTQGTIVLNDQSHASNVDESQNANEMINSKHS